VSRVSTKPPSRPSREWTRPVADKSIKKHPIPVASFIGAFTATAFGIVITFLIVIAAWLIAAHGDESVNQVAAASGIAWLALQLVPVSIGGHALGLLPWGFMVVPIFLTWRGMHWSLKSSEPKSAKDFWQCAGFFSVSCGLLSATVAAFASSDALSVNVIDAGIRSTILSMCVATACVVSFAPSRSILTDSLPRFVSQAIRPGILTFLFLFLCGSVICSVSLVLHFNEVAAVSKLMAPQAFDSFFLTLLCIGYLPTASVWSMSYVIGPGVSLGGSGVVSLYQSHPGSLPAFPLLSILPNSSPSWAHYLIAIPVIAGVLLYFLVPRERWKVQGSGFFNVMRGLVAPLELFTFGIAVAVASGCVLLAAVASSGALGSQLLKFVGPSPLVLFTTTATILLVTVAFLLFLPRILLSLFYLWQHRGESVEPEENRIEE